MRHLLSDASWKAKRHPAYAHTAPQHNFHA